MNDIINSNCNSNRNSENSEKENLRRIEAQNERSLMPPYRRNTPPPTTTMETRSTEHTYERGGGGGVPSSSDSTTTSVLEAAAATPPRLRAADLSTPGAICVGSFHDTEHDNLVIGTEAGTTITTTRMASPNGGTGPAPAASPALFSYYHHQTPADTTADPSSMAGPVVAELAPTSSFSEQEVEDRVTERLEARMSERLQREVDRRLFQERQRHAIAEVVGIPTGTDTSYNHDILPGDEEANPKGDVIRRYGDKHGMKLDDDGYGDGNFEICGIRRTCWGMIFCLILLLLAGGVAGTYLWFDRAREEEINNNGTSDPLDESDRDYNDLPPSQSSLAPISIPNTTLFPSTEPTISPMPSSSMSPSQRPTTTPMPSSTTNTTVLPTPAPSDLDGLSTSMPSAKKSLRWEYLIETVGPYVVPPEFSDDPEAYFVADGDGTNGARYAALDWMATIDSETDVFATPVPLLVERYVLVVLYFSTGTNRTWTDSLSFLTTSNTVCEWNNDSDSDSDSNSDSGSGSEGGIAIKMGVFCRNESPLVTSVELPDNMLQGTIPWELSLLKYLVKIDLDTNQLSGSIPTELGQLTMLRALWLTNNRLTGGLPREFANASQLGSIDLERNSLSSTLPPEWGSLSNLNYVGLHLNQLTGTLPPEWHNMTKLKTLDLASNRLDGTLPQQYGKLTELESVYLESNWLEGLLPPTFGNWTNLVDFFVDGNPLTGTVPAEYSALTKLEYFWFQETALTGSVDGTFCDSGLWNATDMISNCLSGPFGSPAKMECSCCSSCCDSNGENCTSLY